jgi:hypothetical protein
MRSLPLLLLFALLSCARPPPAGAAGPAEAVQAFSEAVAHGDSAAAWALLSTHTQQQADALASEVRARTGSATPASGRQMLFASLLPTGKVTARDWSRDGGAAQVIAVDASRRAHPFRAVREGELWRLDLDLPPR